MAFLVGEDIGFYFLSLQFLQMFHKGLCLVELTVICKGTVVKMDHFYFSTLIKHQVGGHRRIYPPGDQRKQFHWRCLSGFWYLEFYFTIVNVHKEITKVRVTTVIPPSSSVTVRVTS